MNFLPNVLPHASSKTCEVSQLNFFFFFFFFFLTSAASQGGVTHSEESFIRLTHAWTRICPWLGTVAVIDRGGSVYHPSLPESTAFFSLDSRSWMAVASWDSTRDFWEIHRIYFSFSFHLCFHMCIFRIHTRKKKTDRIKAWLQSFHFLCLCVMFAPVSSASFELMPSSRTPRSGPESSGIRVLGNAHWRI